LLAGTHQLLAPLRHFGFDPDRGVVRLMLVLRYVETLPRPRDWRIFLKGPVLAAGEVAEFVEVDSRPLRLTDYLAVLLAGVTCLVFCFR
jgi:hypothetical protein